MSTGSFGNEHRRVQRPCLPRVCLDVVPLHRIARPRIARDGELLRVEEGQVRIALRLTPELAVRLERALRVGRGYLNVSDGTSALSLALGREARRALGRALRRPPRGSTLWNGLAASRSLLERVLGALLLAAMAAPAAASTAAATAASTDPSASRSGEVASPLALHFEPGVEAGSYVARGSELALSMTDRGILLAAPGSDGAVAMSFEGLGGWSLSGARPQPGVSHYLRGARPEVWRTHVPHYGEVRYRAGGCDVELVFHGRGRELEYDVVVGPGGPDAHAAALADLEIAVVGADHVCVDERGELVIDRGGATLRQHVPLVLEEGVEGAAEGARMLRGAFVMRGVGRVGIAVEGSTGEGRLVVDPVLDHATYLGGGRNDAAHAIAVDASGAAFVAGVTSSVTFPTKDALQEACGSCGPTTSDAFVAKIAADGRTLLFSTYLGGSDADAAAGLAVDAAGDLYVAGTTASDDFPVLGAFQPARGGASDAFLAKIAGDGSRLLYATYLGGSEDDRATAVAVTSGRAALVAGATASADFPTAAALQPALAGATDAFLVKLEEEGDRAIFATYLGGPGADEAAALALDDSRRPHVAGLVDGSQLVVLASDGSAFRSRTELPAAGAVGRAVVVDAAGIAHLAYERPGCHAPFSDAGLARVDVAGAVLDDRLLLSCVTGSTHVDAIALHPAGVVVAGESTSAEQLETCEAEVSHGGAGIDAFVVTVDAEGSPVSPTSRYGGLDDERARALAVDAAGGVWIAGDTRSRDLPLREPLQAEPGGRAGTRDAFVARLLPAAAGPPVVDFSATNRSGRPPLQVLFSDHSSCGVTSRTWSFGDGAVSHERNPLHLYEHEGSYAVTLTAGNGSGSSSAVRTDYVTVGEPVLAAFDAAPASGVPPLQVSFTNLSSANARSFLWSFGDGATSTEREPLHVYGAAGSHDVSLLAIGASGRNTEVRRAAVRVVEVLADFEVSPRIVRTGAPVTFRSLATGGVVELAWAFGDGTTGALPVESHAYSEPGYYTVSLRARGATEQDEISREAHVLVSGIPAAGVVIAPGPDPAAAPRVELYDVMGVPAGSFLAYGTPGYGANAAAGDLDGEEGAEVVTGPGPGPAFGPQVRGFRTTGTPLAGINFFAYGTMKHGVSAAPLELDAGGGGEIATGAALAPPFGPHVRGFDVVGGRVGVMPGVSFFAYGTLRHGVVLAGGDLDASGDDELVTGPGPGPTFGAVVRAFDVDGSVGRIPGASFDAFPSSTHGVRVAASALDGVHADILAAPGPSPYLPTRVRAFALEGGACRAISEVDVEAFPGQLYGALPAGGDLDGDGLGELLAARGPDPSAPVEVRGFDVDLEVFPKIPSTVVTAIPSLGVPPGTTRYGAVPATGDLGF